MEYYSFTCTVVQYCSNRSLWFVHTGVMYRLVLSFSARYQSVVCLTDAGGYRAKSKSGSKLFLYDPTPTRPRPQSISQRHAHANWRGENTRRREWYLAKYLSLRPKFLNKRVYSNVRSVLGYLQLARVICYSVQPRARACSCWPFTWQIYNPTFANLSSRGWKSLASVNLVHEELNPSAGFSCIRCRTITNIAK
jgi:hypothetical protein